MRKNSAASLTEDGKKLAAMSFARFANDELYSLKESLLGNHDDGSNDGYLSLSVKDKKLKERIEIAQRCFLTARMVIEKIIQAFRTQEFQFINRMDADYKCREKDFKIERYLTEISDEEWKEQFQSIMDKDDFEMVAKKLCISPKEIIEFCSSQEIKKAEELEATK